MAKVIFEFDLSDEDERNDFEMFRKGRDFCIALRSISDFLRNVDKWGIINGRELTEVEENFITEIRNEFYILLADYDINGDIL